MRKIEINASKSYDVKIDCGILHRVGEEILQIRPRSRALIVCDENVAPLYLSALKKSLSAASIGSISYIIPPSENAKSLAVLAGLLEYAAEHGITQTDLFIALGGGVTGDLCGFAASVYLRGVDFVQVPTTLLSAVDSSVGGKTAVNLPSGKNLVGAFHQPILVLCDPNLLLTLPKSELACGMGECIKYAMLKGFELLDTDDILEIIASCVEIKKEYVLADEHDKGTRQMLNLGHTIAHAIEKLSGFSVSHGEAVAAGLAAVTRSAEALGLCEAGTYSQLLSLLHAHALSEKCGFSSAELASAALSDKKRRGSTISLILPRKIGECYIAPYKIDELEAFIEAGAEYGC